jgi:hypothetical protein
MEGRVAVRGCMLRSADNLSYLAVVHLLETDLLHGKPRDYRVDVDRLSFFEKGRV